MSVGGVDDDDDEEMCGEIDGPRFIYKWLCVWEREVGQKNHDFLDDISFGSAYELFQW